MEIETWPIDKVIPYDTNPRVCPEKAVAKVAESLRTYGWRQPIVVDTEGVIIAGHTRRKAAELLGLKTVPVHVAHDMDPDDVRAYRIADNRVAEETSWDKDLLAFEVAALNDADFDLSGLGFEDDEVARLLSASLSAETSSAEVERAEETPEPPVNPVTIEGDVWLLGKHRLICGDTTRADVLDRVGAKSIDCVFTSPPYAVGIDYGIYKDTLENLRSMLPVLASEWMARVVSGGFAITNFGDIVAAQEIVGSKEPCEYPMAMEYWPAFRGAGWNLWTRRIWKKPHARVHSPWVIQSSRAAADWEHVWVWKKSGKELTGRGNVSAFGVWDSEGGHGVDVGKQTHGAGMPVAIATKALETYSRPGKIVFEPFSGTGTTMMAAELTGRHCVGTEVNPQYVDVSVERWYNFTGLDDVHESGGETFEAMKAKANADTGSGDRESSRASSGGGSDTERVSGVPVGSGSSIRRGGRSGRKSDPGAGQSDTSTESGSAARA